MRPVNNNITIFSDAEFAALYEIPEFDSNQRLKYLTLTDSELCFVLTRKTLSSQVACVLQFGYFKAVQLFFKFNWKNVNSNDIQFILQQYFNGVTFDQQILSKHEYYTQCNGIATILGYRMWSNEFNSLLIPITENLRRDIKPQFIAMELLAFFKEHKIIRPGYTSLQNIVSEIINNERTRLNNIIKSSLTQIEQEILNNFLIEDDKLSKLAAIKQDAKNFKPQMMNTERNKLLVLSSAYKIIKRLLPALKLSQQNMQYYASLVNFYSIYDLRKKIKIEQTYLYILCYCWLRYQQISDNLVNAFCFHYNQFNTDIKELSASKFSEHVKNNHDDAMDMIKLAQLYIDDNLSDDINFGIVREKAFAIVSKTDLIDKVNKPNRKTKQESDFYWLSIDEFKRGIKSYLRNLVTVLDFSSITSDNVWISAIKWIKEEFSKPNTLIKVSDHPEGTIPVKLLPFFTIKDNNKPDIINKSRYEFWVYRHLYRYLNTGRIFLEDSLKYRSLSQELVSMEDKDILIQQLNIPVLAKPINQQLDELLAEQDRLLKLFNKLLKKGKLKHIKYDSTTETIHWQKIKIDKDEKFRQQFYSQLSLCDISDVLRFVNKRCGFLSAFTHVQPRYSKQPAKNENLMGALIAQAMNNGNHNMAEISDIPYAVLQDTLQSRIRIETLKAANDIISNDITRMSIFPHYSFDFDLLYGGVDGQKFEAATPTIKSRGSKKYFGGGRGIVAYTLLANHIPLQVELIGANEHESYFVFDIWYNNTSDVSPEVVTGDMHCINKANFAIMHWFGGALYPRFTNIEAQRKHIYCGENKPEYDKYLVKPSGAINRELIESEWYNLQRIMASLGLKEISQSTLVRKLCTYKQEHRTRMALFEFDKLIRSIYILKYLLDPNIYHNAHKSQNRVEQYHQLRSAVAQAYGKKELIGKTDLALEISNQCGRLISNAIIHYNSAILSKLLDKYQVENNQKALAKLKKISPVAWQHIHFLGHLTFSEERTIDLDEVIKNLDLNSSPQIAA